MTKEQIAEGVIHIAKQLSNEMDKLSFTTPSHVYNPLHYAWAGQQQYLEKYAGAKHRVVLVGMNPGPWGMAQTGVPFGEIGYVRDWLGIEAKIEQPLTEQHAKYPIQGFECRRSEGSGKRFWGWAKDRFDSPKRYFEHFFVWNYCPLLFIGEDRNLIPEKLTAEELKPVMDACNSALLDLLQLLEPSAVVGIGRWAERRLKDVVGENAEVGYLFHPSPANPRANRNWAALADSALLPLIKK